MFEMRKVLNFLFFYFFSMVVVTAQVGELDVTFAADGVFQGNLSGGQEAGADVVTQPDGKVLALFSGTFPEGNNFDFAVVRLNYDGSIDSSFAVDGVYHYLNLGGSDLAYHIELLEDGSMILAGSYTSAPAKAEWLMIKLTSAGVPDLSFGVDGVVIFPVDTEHDYIRSLAIADDGKIYAGGYSLKPGFNSNRRLAIGRFNPEGSIDSTYGDNGVFMWKDDDTQNYLATISLNSDGSMYVGGTTRPSSADRPTLFKILPEGAGLDTSFGDDGESVGPAEGRAGGMAVHPNGNILLCSPALSSNKFQLAVIAYNPDGSINGNFGRDGIFIASDTVSLGDYALDVTVQSDGKIIVCGESIIQNIRLSRFISARCDENGIIDTTWGGTGVYSSTFNTGIGWASSVHFDTNDGSVYLAGTAQFPVTFNDLVVLRFNNLVDADDDGFYLGMDDCDDGASTVNPNGIEIAGNGIDEDCNGEDLLVRVRNVELSNQFTIAPNPSSNFTFISYDNNAITPQLVELSDFTGRCIQLIEWTALQGRIPVDLQSLSNGVYILSIHTQEGIAVKKIIKQ
jgi:uncharacterized delta-60 repeat protein